MRLCQTLCGIIILCAATAPLSATVITFDDISNIPSFGNPVNVRATFVGLGIEDNYSGFQWPSPSATQFWGVVNNADFAFGLVGAFSDSQAAWNWGGAISQDILFPTPETVVGAYFNVFEPAQPWDADAVQLRAYDAAGDLVGTSNLVYLDKTGQHPEWDWVSLNADDVSRLNISAMQSNPDWAGLGWWAMDNLTVVPEAAVPELSSATLILVGFVVCILAQWRTKRTMQR